jgi:hypothetical protein
MRSEHKGFLSDKMQLLAFHEQENVLLSHSIPRHLEKRQRRIESGEFRTKIFLLKR